MIVAGDFNLLSSENVEYNTYKRVLNLFPKLKDVFDDSHPETFDGYGCIDHVLATSSCKVQEKRLETFGRKHLEVSDHWGLCVLFSFQSKN